MSNLCPEGNTLVKRCLPVFLAFVLLYGNAAWAADCERLHMFGVRPGDSRSEVRAILGEPYSTTRDISDRELDWFHPESTRLFVRYDEKGTAIYLSGTFLQGEHGKILDAITTRLGEPTIKPTVDTAPYYRPGLVWRSEECDTHVFSFKADLHGRAEESYVEMGPLSTQPMAVPSERSTQSSQEPTIEPTPKIGELTQEMTAQETAQAQDSSDKSAQEQTPASGDGEDLTRKWGPEEQPDLNAEPLQFLYWRVDAMFERGDGDGDGRMDMDEFAGETYNFERIDRNADGFLTKQEVVDDMIPVLRAEGKLFIDG